MSNDRHTPYPSGTSLDHVTMEIPLGELDAAIVAEEVARAAAVTAEAAAREDADTDLQDAIAAVALNGSGFTTSLDGSAASGQKVVPLTATTNLVSGQSGIITDGTNTEAVVIDTVSAGVNVHVVSNLVNSYSAGAVFSVSPAELVLARGVFRTLDDRLDAFEYRLSQLTSSILLGKKWVFLGDSITIGGESGDPQKTMLPNYVSYAAISSTARINREWNAGVGGNTLAQMLARFDDDVTPHAPDVVFLLGGTNDMAATPLATSQANVADIVAKILDIGATPVLCTIPPRDTSYHSAITAFNRWITDYAEAYGFDLIDFWTLLADPDTEDYKAGYSADGTHPQLDAEQYMGQLVVDTLDGRLTPAAFLPTDPDDADNLFSNGLFDSWGTPVAPPTIGISKVGGSSALTAGTYYYKVSLNRAYGEGAASNEVSIAISNGDVITLSIPMTSSNDLINVFRGTAPGAETLLEEHVVYGGVTPHLYVDNGSLTPAGRTPPSVNNSSQPTGWASGNATPMELSQVTDDGIEGVAAHMEPAIASTVNMSKTVTMSGAFEVGDVLALVFKFRTSGDAWPVLQWQFTGADTYQYYQFDSDLPVPEDGWGAFYREVEVPAGTTALKLFVGLQAVIPQWVEFGQIAVYNLTELGLD